MSFDEKSWMYSRISFSQTFKARSLAEGKRVSVTELVDSIIAIFLVMLQNCSPNYCPHANFQLKVFGTRPH